MNAKLLEAVAFVEALRFPVGDLNVEVYVANAWLLVGFGRLEHRLQRLGSDAARAVRLRKDSRIIALQTDNKPTYCKNAHRHEVEVSNSVLGLHSTADGACAGSVTTY